MRSLPAVIAALAIPAYFLSPPLSGIFILLALAVLLLLRKRPKLKSKRPVGVIVDTEEGPRVYLRGLLREFESSRPVEVGDKVKVLEIKGPKLIVEPIIKSRDKKE